MLEFPPKPEHQVTLANWRTAPLNHLAFQHVREIVPSADIPNDPRNVWELAEKPVDLSGLQLESADGGPIGFSRFLERTGTDGFVVVHGGRIVAESYGNGMTAETPHILMSVSKSLLGLLAGILAERGELDVEAVVTDYIPEIAKTAYAGATVRHLLDMRAGIQFDEDYLATSGPIIEYRKATNWNPLEQGETPSDLRGFFSTLTDMDGWHGGRFHYVSPNTDLMAWVIERAAGRRFADLMSELLWSPMGAERSGYITVDRLGAPRAAGGICVTVRDLARIGQLLVQNGRRGDAQIIPRAWIDDFVSNGDAEAWASGDFVDYFSGLPIRYRSKWYFLDGDSPILFGFGIHGQYLFVDHANEIVIAKLSSRAMPLDKNDDSLTIQAVTAIQKFLGALI